MQNRITSSIVVLVLVVVFSTATLAEAGQAGGGSFDPRDLSGVYLIRHPDRYEGMGEPPSGRRLF